MSFKVKTSTYELESLEVYCQRISKKNNSLLYLLENHLGKPLLSDDELIGIRSLILTVSVEISRLPKLIKVDDDNHERL